MIRELLEETIQKIETEREPHIKETFWATDFEKDPWEIYHRFKATPFTNPPKTQTLLTFDAGRRMEESLVDVLKATDYDVETQKRLEYKFFDVTITGRPDVIIEKEGHSIPVEIKSYYGYYQEKELQAYNPKLSYLKQLAFYILALDVNMGILLYRERGLGTIHEFPVYRIYKTGLMFKCGTIEFSLLPDLLDWQNLLEQNIKNSIEPERKFRYKHPIDGIDWHTVPSYKIAQIRNGGLVLGDWQVKYSPYKDLYIEREGTCVGYSDEELAQILVATKGYITWGKINHPDNV